MERAQAYKMKLVALKHQGKKLELQTDSTSPQVGEKSSWAVSIVANDANASRSQVQRFVRLNELVPEIQEKVDSKEIAFSPAVELSYLTHDEQKQFLDAMDYSQNTPSLSQAQRLKKLSREGKCTKEAMRSIMSEEKKEEQERITLSSDTLRKYFPRSYTPLQIRHEGMSESKQFVTLLDEMIQEDSEQAVFGLKRITLASLLKAHKVDFFDDFGAYTHKEWKLTDIINVTVNKDEKSIDDENDETTSGEIDASEPTGRLSGISSAILKGDGLRNNDFVKECMSQGFIFSSMSYKLSHKTLPITIVIDVNFKQTDLKINIVKTYQLEDDGIERLAPLPASDQSLYIDYFQNVAYAVYSNLIEKQKTELVKQTIKPEK